MKEEFLGQQKEIETGQEILEKKAESEKEMNDFAKFLKDKFLKG